MRKFIMLLLMAHVAAVSADDWGDAITVDSIEELHNYWRLSETPSAEEHAPVFEAAGGASLLHVEMRILVRSDGTVDARISESSGNEGYDLAVRELTEKFLYEPTETNSPVQAVNAPFSWGRKPHDEAR
jgi:hypothetical protein